MICKIKSDGFQTFFEVDGKKVVPSAYMSYNPKKEYIDPIKKAGVNTFMFPIYAADEGINMESGLRPFCDNFFKGYGEYDFSVVEKALETIGNEDGIYIIPRVSVEPPIWWQKANPDELSRDHRGEAQRECFTSQKWREDMSDCLKALIDFFKSSKWKDNIIGIHLAAGGTEEWTYNGRYARQYYDYSRRNKEAYIKWLRDKYSSVEKLSLAWGKEVKSFDEIDFPKPIEREYAKSGFLRNAKGEKPVLDYFDFHNEAVADTINYFSKQVKDHTEGNLITGVFYGYVFSMPHNYKGLHALARVIESPYVDFISTTNIGMEPGEAWVFSSAVRSAQLNGKLWMAEGDIRTHLTRGLDVSMPHAAPDNDFYGSSVWVGPPSCELSCSALTKAISRTVCSNCGIWWFDMFGGWLNDERLLEIISKFPDVYTRQKHNYLKPEVAVIIDEKGYKYYATELNTTVNAVREVGKSLSHAGILYDIYLQSDIQKNNFPSENYKLFIFLAGVDPSENDKHAIESKLKSGGKTLLWLHGASFFDSSLCDFKLKAIDTYTPRLAEYKKAIYPENPLPTLSFENDDGYILSRFKEGDAAVIWKDMGTYSSVYSLVMAPHPELFRDIALLSGVHIFNYKNDCVFAGGEFIAIHACEEGYHRLNLTEKGFKAKNALTNEMIAVNDLFIDLKMKKYETVIINIYK